MSSDFDKTVASAYFIGMDACFEAFGIESKTGDNMMKVMNIVKDVCDGKLTLRETEAELRMRGIERTTPTGKPAVIEEQELAEIICRVFAEWLFHDADEDELDDD